MYKYFPHLSEVSEMVRGVQCKNIRESCFIASKSTELSIWFPIEASSMPDASHVTPKQGKTKFFCYISPHVRLTIMSLVCTFLSETLAESNGYSSKCQREFNVTICQLEFSPTHKEYLPVRFLLRNLRVLFR